MGRGSRSRESGELRILDVVVVGGVVFLLVAGLIWAQVFSKFSDYNRVEAWNGESIRIPRCVVRDTRSGDVVHAESNLLLEWPPEYERANYSFLITGRGCGALRFRGDAVPDLKLPPPVQASIRFAGNAEIPNGIKLSFTPESAPFEESEALAFASARASFWSEASPRPSYVWVDAETRRADVLLPEPGRWRIDWDRTMHTPNDGPDPNLLVVLGSGTLGVHEIEDGGVVTIDVPPDAFAEEDGS
ncbi:MAG: hypothetical protein AAGD14_09900 [Planctomycetota bacterium]